MEQSAQGTAMVGFPPQKNGELQIIRQLIRPVYAKMIDAAPVQGFQKRKPVQAAIRVIEDFMAVLQPATQFPGQKQMPGR